jgi:hypothetical protein
MITSINIKSNNGSWITANAYNSNVFDERVDEQLDTGSIQIITNTEEVVFNDFCAVRVVTTDAVGDTKKAYYCGFNTQEKRGAGYFINTLELVEPTRILMGVIIEGRRVTQPIGSEEKQTLYDVAEGLLLTCETLSYNEKGKRFSPRFKLVDNEEIVSLLQSVVSPEFHWEAGTLLWECLLDIGNVINAMPRLLFNEATDEFDTITFDLINEETKEYEL